VQKADTEKQKSRLQAIQITESKTVWCTDYTTEAEGEVATIEIDGEQPGILIAPGAPPHDTSYGTLYDRMVVTPEAAFLNGAILPGWQKYSPTYRVGQIADIDRENDLCTVYLDDATSSAQGLDINQASALFDVPIDYMTCNSAAFENWDRVVVKFEGQTWSNPKVIGFESEPKKCGPDLVAVLVVRDAYLRTNGADLDLFNDSSTDVTETLAPGYTLRTITQSGSSPSATQQFNVNIYTKCRVIFDKMWKCERRDDWEWSDVFVGMQEENDGSYYVSEYPTPTVVGNRYTIARAPEQESDIEIVAESNIGSTERVQETVKLASYTGPQGSEVPASNPVTNLTFIENYYSDLIREYRINPEGDDKFADYVVDGFGPLVGEFEPFSFLVETSFTNTDVAGTSPGSLSVLISNGQLSGDKMPWVMYLRRKNLTPTPEETYSENGAP